MSRLLLLAAGSLFLGSANGALQGATCYNDDGQILEGDVPCNPNADQSFCCGIHWTCLDSGVCSDQNTTQLISPGEALLARATCTDRTFKSDACPQFCLGGMAYLHTVIAKARAEAADVPCRPRSRHYVILGQ